MFKKHKKVNIIKLKDLDPVRAAYIHSTLGQHPKKRNGDFVEILIDKINNSNINPNII